MKTSNYPWWEEVPSSEPIDQGSIIQDCRVLQWEWTETYETSRSKPVEDYYAPAREECLVMTQACDLAQGKIEVVTLCPLYDELEVKVKFQQGRGDRKITDKEWDKLKEHIRVGRYTSIATLNPYQPKSHAKLRAWGTRYVLFDVIYTLPLDLVQQWVEQSVPARLQLLPPYREEISQAFARSFMRIGLPIDRI